MSSPASAIPDVSASDADVIHSSTVHVDAGLSASTSTTHLPDFKSYSKAAATLLPQWLRILSPSPWSLVLKNRHEPAISCHTQQLRLAASWAVTKLTEFGVADANIATFSELSRATLIHWQLGLLADGKPRRVADRKNNAIFPAAWYVVRTLEDTAVSATPMLLDDLAKHLSWLVTRSSASSWSEATAVGAAASGGVLLRDTNLVKHARKRLSALITKQSSEGWFPEASRFDLIKQAQVIGVLGQLLHAYDWTELENPLQRAVEFFASITVLDSDVHSLSLPLAGAFLFPQGFELLGAHLPVASRIANGCRRLSATIAGDASEMLSDELAALAGSDMLATAAAKPIKLTNPSVLPDADKQVTTHPKAGLATVRHDLYTAVFSTKQSGAWQAYWRSFNQNIFDPPIALVQATGRLRTACNEHVTTIKSYENHIEVVGFFSDSSPKKGRHNSMSHKLHRDGFRRELTFLKDEIRVLDEIWCTIPCQAILLQYADTDHVVSSLGYAHPLPKTPLIINGGHAVIVERVYKSGKLIHIRRKEASSRQRI